VDSFGYHNEAEELPLPQEGFGGIHLQLMRPHDIEYCLQICYVIAFGMTFHYNIVYVVFYRFLYMLMKNCIHSFLVCRARILQPEGHRNIEVYP